MTYFIGPIDDPDRYHLEQLVARGGEGELWKATITVDGVSLPVAAKLLAASQGPDLDEWAQRWRRQTELLRTLDHPNLVKVREVFTGPVAHLEGAADLASVGLFLVMNWVDGTNLEGWVAQNPQRDLLDSLRVIGPVAAAVDYLHGGAATGGPILHRDIKPANVIVEPGGGVKLVDFGFAHLGPQPATTLVGTPAFLAPEVVAGGPATTASDRFSLGATTYYVLTGEVPDLADFGGSRNRLLAVRGSGGRADIADHILAMVNPDPSQRPADAVSWAQALAAGAVSGTFGTGVLTDGPALTPSAARPRAGERLVVSDSPELQPRGPETVAAPPVTGRKGRRKLWVGLAAAVAAVAVAVVAAFLIGGKDGDGQQAAADRSPAGANGQRDGEGSDGGSGRDTSATTSARATRVPDVTGMSLSEATAKLEKLGIEVKTKSVLDDSKADGTVLDQDPAGGASFVGSVMLSVARQPVLVYLTDMTAVAQSDGYADTETKTVEINAKQYLQSLSWGCDNEYADSYCGSEGISAEYNLSRSYRRFQTTVGLGDTSPSEALFTFRVLGDGRVLYEKQLGLGQEQAIDVDVTGVLRLRLMAVASSTFDDTAYANWGSARLLGAPDEVPDPSTTSTSG